MGPDQWKNKIRGFAADHGADVVGFADPDIWGQQGEVPLDFRPRRVWPPTETVIALGIGMLLPIVETTPSRHHTELYQTCNLELDRLAFSLARYLNRQGHASISIPRDGYGSIDVLAHRPLALFSHKYAAKYAGLGTIGLNHVLLTPEFGPRVRLVSVFTSLKLPPDPVLEGDLCVRCLACAQCCPVGALQPREGSLLSDYDIMACVERHRYLTSKRCYPCGTCIKVCPVGQDRDLYKSRGYASKYREEEEALARNHDHPDYRSWVHARRYGSWPADSLESAEIGSAGIESND